MGGVLQGVLGSYTGWPRLLLLGVAEQRRGKGQVFGESIPVHGINNEWPHGNNDTQSLFHVHVSLIIYWRPHTVFRRRHRQCLEDEKHTSNEL